LPWKRGGNTLSRTTLREEGVPLVGGECIVRLPHECWRERPRSRVWGASDLSLDGEMSDTFWNVLTVQKCRLHFHTVLSHLGVRPFFITAMRTVSQGTLLPVPWFSSHGTVELKSVLV